MNDETQANFKQYQTTKNMQDPENRSQKHESKTGEQNNNFYSVNVNMNLNLNLCVRKKKAAAGADKSDQSNK